MNSFYWKCLSVLALALLVAGCGDGGPRLYKAGGTVTHKDKPVDGATVTFVYDNGDFAVGTTGVDGKFNLAYKGNPKGTALGKCTVSVVKTAGGGTTAVPTSNDPMEIQKMMEKKFKEDEGKSTTPQNELPAKYAVAATSGLSFEVVADEKKNDFPIVLKD